MPPLNSITDSPYFAGRIAPPRGIQAVRQFNPSIGDWNGERWIAWRVEHLDGTSSIALGILNQEPGTKNQITSSQVLPIPGFVEDPRLLTVGDELLLQLARVDSDSGTVTQEFYQITPRGDLAGPPFIPAFFGNGLNGRLTKNWTAFDHQGRLHVQHWPGQDLVADCEAGTAQWHNHGAFTYPFGTLSGRTPALLLPTSDFRLPTSEYLALGGGRTPHPRRGSRYYVTAWTFSAESPFFMRRVSARPLLWAAEHDERIPHPNNPRYHDCCIYPAGIILEPSTKNQEPKNLLISAGVNDTFMILLRIPISALDLVPLDHPFEVRDIWHPGSPIPAGTVPVRVLCAALDEDGTIWQRGDHFLTTPERADALGSTVQIIHQHRDWPPRNRMLTSTQVTTRTNQEPRTKNQEPALA